jgi:serine protease Do
MGRVLPEVSGYNDFIQTDASINQGNSGGPLINTNGEVIGINTAIDPRGQGIGFAIPINTAKRILPNLQAGKHVARGWLGINLGNITDDIAEYMGLKEGSGALVVESFPDSPAYKAGLRNYDVIVSFDGNKIENPSDIIRYVGQSSPGSVHSVNFIRSGKIYTAKVTLASRDEEINKPVATGKGGKRLPPAQGRQEDDSISNNLGLYTEDLSAENIHRYRIPNVRPDSGVVVVQVGPPASQYGVRIGDIIIEVNKAAISNARDLNNAIKNKGTNLIKVNRGGTVYLIAIK